MKTSTQSLLGLAAGLVAGSTIATIKARRTINQLSWNSGFGMLNQGGADRRQARLIRQLAGRPVDVLSIDMDYFKQINLAVGERRSNVLVKAVFSQLRSGDAFFVGQLWSGDEYRIVVRVGTGRGLADRLLVLIAEQTDALTPAERERWQMEMIKLGNDPRTPLSATIGLAESRSDVVHALEDAADARSASKQRGERGRVVLVG